MTKPSRIGEIEARLAGATPGPWHYDGQLYIFTAAPNMVAEIRGAGWNAPQDANGALVANAPTDIRYLLDQVTALTASRERLRAALERYKQFAITTPNPNYEPGRAWLPHTAGPPKPNAPFIHSFIADEALTADDEALRALIGEG